MDVIRAIVSSARSERGHARLSDELQRYLGVSAVFLLSSGKAALACALRAMAGLEKSRRVAIPAYTCYTVPAAVVHAGLDPVLIDVDPESLDFDDVSLRRVIARENLLAIVPTHLFGVPADVARVRSLVSARVCVLEDAAQAFGVRASDGRPLGSLGDASVLSFARGKHATSGSGGALATSSPRLARAFREAVAGLPDAGRMTSVRIAFELAMMSAFIDPRLYWLPAGLPFLGLGRTVYSPDFPVTPMPAIASAALSGWEQRLERSNQQRIAAVEAWRTTLGLASQPTTTGPLLRLPVMLSEPDARTALVDASRQKGLGLATMYPEPVHRIPELRSRFADQRFPGAEDLAKRLVTLPTHAHVQPHDRDRVREIWPVPAPHGAQEGHPSAASC